MDSLFAKVKGKKEDKKPAPEKAKAPDKPPAKEPISVKTTGTGMQKPAAPREKAAAKPAAPPPVKQAVEPASGDEKPFEGLPALDKSGLEEIDRLIESRIKGRKGADEEAKIAEEASKKIEEMKKELPPQEKVIFTSPEKVPVEQKTQMEKELERSREKIEIDAYGNIKIYRIPGQPLLYYWTPVVRPGSGEKAIINTIREAATRIISITPYKIRDPEQRRNVYYQRIMEIIRNAPELNIPKTKFEFYADAVVREMVGYGMIDFLIQDNKLEEIMVIGPNAPVYVFHRKYEMMVTNIEFTSDNEIQDLINRIARQVGRRVDISSPLLDARLPDGSRVNATMPPSTVQGSTLTIRKFRAEPYNVIDLIRNGTMNVEAAAFLWMCTDGMNTRPANILISGGTGSGKTTTLNVLASFIPESERIITIEDTAELNLPLKHWIRMEARPPGLEGTGELTMDILTKNALRMRPDRIIVGEIRHDEAFTLFTAFNTGHDGCLTGESKLALTTGIREIGEFVDWQMSKNRAEKNGDWEMCSVKNEYINSIDESGKITKSEIVQAMRRPYTGNVYHVKLASGSEITCTPNHPFYTLEKGIVQLRADKMTEGQRIATPRKLIRDANASEPETEYWSGMLHGDGSILDKKRIREKNGKLYTCSEGRVSLYSEEQERIPDFIRFMKEKIHAEHVAIVGPRPGKNCYEAHMSGSGKSKQVQELLDIPSGSRAKAKMSNSHFTASLREFVAGFFDAEGYVDTQNNALVFTCANENYIDFFRHALLTDGIVSRKYESRAYNSRWFRVYVYGLEQARKFSRIFPIRSVEKRKKLKEILDKAIEANTNVDLIECNDEIIELLAKAREKGFSNSEIARRAGITQGLVSFYKRKERIPSTEAVKRLAEAFESAGIDSLTLKALGEADIFWDKIVAIHSHPYSGYVYDLTLNEKELTMKNPHNFVVQGFVAGNSLGTVHANSAEETIVRVTSPPMNVPEVMLSGLNFIIIQHRLHDKKIGTIRRITEISEVTGTLRGKAKTEMIFKRDALSDTLKRTDAAMEYMVTLQDMTGMTRKQIEQEISRRADFLQKLVSEKEMASKEVAEKIRDYMIGKGGLNGFA
ncbi:MAG: Flp pilus assembly complex ATPase component TadA [Candidatus Diapherotrites archaeon]|uniref:Flp pilus assembly complex ATPase component TadA n=1 Tax=Candidatus Iainarchaeum sp. TaxID=3101447 RepID=A0A8T3YJ24_9ARCH|nr:Flp pilus assembly complex ATPase component TadA [Candidatus Diapherotrites archaeon]